MQSSGIIDLAIGLIFVFAVAAALSSFVTELLSRLIGLRAAYLLSGLRELVDGGKASTDLGQDENDYKKVQDIIKGRTAPPDGSLPPGQPSPAESPMGSPQTTEAVAETAAAKVPSVTGALLSSPILANQGVAGQCTSRKLTLARTTGTGHLPKMTADRTAGRLWRQRRSLPSYISSRSFAEAVIDLVVPDQAGQTTMTAVQQGIKALPEGMMSPFKESLEALAKNAENDIGQFRTCVERWYNDHMDRVSGWYKRHVAKITLVVGAVLIVLLNINALTIGRTLYTENEVSTAVSNVAAKATSCTAKESPQECLANLQAQLSVAATAGLPIGWGTVRDCNEPGARCNWLDQRGIFSRHGNSGGQLLLVLIGFLIMVISLVPGAQFWFGLLSKLGTLRAAGPKPATADS